MKRRRCNHRWEFVANRVLTRWRTVDGHTIEGPLNVAVYRCIFCDEPTVTTPDQRRADG